MTTATYDAGPGPSVPPPDVGVVTVAVVDPMRGHRDGLCGAVQLAPDLALAGSAARVDELGPEVLAGLDALIVQAGVPGDDLLAEVAAARRLVPRGHLTVLCGFVDDYTVEQLTEGGASAVVSTDVALADVFDIVARRAAACPPHGEGEGLRRARQIALALGITEREHLVLRLLAEGQRPQGIAHDLRVSVDTVRDHLKGLRRKLDCAGAVELVVAAYRMGVLPSLGRPIR